MVSIVKRKQIERKW